MGQVSDEWYNLHRQAEGAFSRDSYSRAEELWMMAMPFAEQLGEDDDRLLKTVTGICRAMIMQKRDWDVIPWLYRSLALTERHHGLNNENCARITFRLAKTYKAYSMPVEAEEQFKRSLAIHTKVYGPADSFTVEVLSEYAELLQELHREDEAQHMMYCALGYLGGEWKPVSQSPQEHQQQQEQYEQQQRELQQSQQMPQKPQQQLSQNIDNNSTPEDQSEQSGFNRVLKRRQ
ncbi:MAG: tetratricopeptide repeat protein [Candidatus Obscuribacterales bacterium]|nr:tetratricopeptide repeat protein [Candidatus Obscuribacterales bacterium]